MKFEYHQPDSVEGVIALLTRYGPDVALLAGGTALLIDMQNSERSPGHLISLWGIPRLANVHVNGGLRVGALATITDLAEAVISHQPLRGLLEAAWLLGGRQVQNMATVGGNICKASPGADMVPPLLCLDATLTLVGPNGERMTPLDGFLTGPDQTAIQPGEVLTEITVPAVASRSGTAFLKVMRRHAVDCSIVAIACRVTLADIPDRSPRPVRCSEIRIAIGAAAPNPFRSKRAEAVLTGQPLEPDRVQEAARQAREASQPISDVRASADYRRMLVETLVERAVLRAAERAAQGGDRR